MRTRPGRCHHGAHGRAAARTHPTGGPGIDPSLVEDVTADVPWQAIVWNDPVNLMSYVTYVLQKLFGYPEPKATALMLDVHHKGKAAVSAATRKDRGRRGEDCTPRGCGRRCSKA